MFDLSKFTHQSPRPIVGAMQLNKTYVFHDQSFETACWWEDSEAQLGIYPIYLSRAYHHPKYLTLVAEIKAKVVDDYFPGLWCGMPISREPYKSKHVGEDRLLKHGVDINLAIDSTGNSTDSDKNYFLHPSWLSLFQEEAEMELRKDYQMLPSFWEKWNTLNEKTFISNNSSSIRWDFKDEYCSSVRMIGHFGRQFEMWAKRLDKISWARSYRDDNGRNNSEYNRNLFKNNTEWTKAINIQVNE